jgi:hypothetical protein
MVSGLGHSEAAERGGEIVAQELQAIFDPLLAVGEPFAHEHRPPQTAADTLIPAGDGGIDNVFSCSGHELLSIKGAGTL